MVAGTLPRSPSPFIKLSPFSPHPRCGSLFSSLRGEYEYSWGGYLNPRVCPCSFVGSGPRPRGELAGLHQAHHRCKPGPDDPNLSPASVSYFYGVDLLASTLTQATLKP
ncbi:hypothetical protein PIB30_084446, partial [Stylosanthes scabra]|nr:hypothetical protein [Stylosanthes scabra]